jgi:hypothetical protein
VIGTGGSAPHAVAGKSPSIPGVVAEDAVCFSNDVPPLHVVKISSISFARLDVLRLELCPEYSAPHPPPPRKVTVWVSGAGAGRFDGTLRDFVDRLAKRFRGKVEIVNLLEVHPEIGT